MRRIANFLRRFRRDQTGLSAVEFALVLPVMLTSLMGATEITSSMVADRKLAQVASTLADLTAMDTEITNAEMNAIFDCGRAILLPLDVAPLSMRVTSVYLDDSNVTRVRWSTRRGSGFGDLGANTRITIPSGMLTTPGSTIILAEIAYTYTSPLGATPFIGEVLSLNNRRLQDQFYLRPRRSLEVDRVA